MALTNKIDQLGIPPQVFSTLAGLNNVLTELGFPRWILVKWQVPPLFSLWLIIVLLVSGLKWFAMFQIIFVVLKLFDDYGLPEIFTGRGPAIQHRSRSRSRQTRSRQPVNNVTIPATSARKTEDIVEDELEESETADY